MTEFRRACRLLGKLRRMTETGPMHPERMTGLLSKKWACRRCERPDTFAAPITATLETIEYAEPASRVLDRRSRHKGRSAAGVSETRTDPTACAARPRVAARLCRARVQSAARPVHSTGWLDNRHTR